MTKEREIEILNAAINRMASGHIPEFVFGLCVLFALMQDEGAISFEERLEIVADLRFTFLEEGGEVRVSGLWFSAGDYESRIALIKRRIQQLKDSLDES